MKKIITILTVLVLLLTVMACGGNPTASSPDGQEDTRNLEDSIPESIRNQEELITDWNIALELLKDGNKRYLENKSMARDITAKDRDVLKDSQQPFAVIVTCSDSRVAPEIYFDQKLGDIFVIRNAGNIVDASALGSIEYAVEYLHTPLVVVVGHSRCGAVMGAFSGGEYSENLQFVLDNISAAIEGSENFEEAIHVNINDVCRQISENEVVERIGAPVIGAYYDIVTGEVIFE